MQETNEKNNSTYRHALKYTGVFGGVQGFYILMAVIRSKFTAMLIGSAGIGLADLYNKTCEFVGNSTNFGLSFSAIRRISELYEEGNREALLAQVRLVRSWSVIAAAFGLIVGLAFSPLLSYTSTGSLDATGAFAALAPMIPLLTLSGCELAVLKGVRRLKRIAFASAVSAVSTLLLTVPIYWWLGLRGVIPVLLVTTAATFVINLSISSKVVPWSVQLGSWKYLKGGATMIRLGLAYIGAGMLTSGAEMAVRFFMNRVGTIEDVGLYAAGFTLTVSYARIVFVAMDADYFPRLSGVNADVAAANLLVNRQIDVCVWLMTPFLLAFSLFLPIIIHILYTPEFLQIDTMVLLALPCMYFKAVTTPIAYLSLARGDSFTFLLMESLYDVAFMVAVIFGYTEWGLAGAGGALSVAYFADLLLITFVYRRRYGFRYDARTLRLALLHFGLLFIGIGSILSNHSVLKYAGCGGALFCSGLLSLFLFRKIRKR